MCLTNKNRAQIERGGVLLSLVQPAFCDFIKQDLLSSCEVTVVFYKLAAFVINSHSAKNIISAYVKSRAELDELMK